MCDESSIAVEGVGLQIGRRRVEIARSRCSRAIKEVKVDYGELAKETLAI